MDLPRSITWNWLFIEPSNIWILGLNAKTPIFTIKIKKINVWIFEGFLYNKSVKNIITETLIR